VLILVTGLGAYLKHSEQKETETFPDFGFGQPSESPHPQDSFLHSHPSFGMTGVNLINFLPSLPEEAQIWPIDNPQNPFSDPEQQDDLWTGMNCQDSSIICEQPSQAETRALLSELSNSHWTYMSDASTSRSSGISSRTWGTASSFSDLYSEPDLARLSKTSNYPPPLLSANNTIQEESENCHCPCEKRESKNKILPARPSTGKSVKTKPKVPEKEKGPAKYFCTECHDAFIGKGEWVRHENAKHDPQFFWICMLEDPAVQTPSGWKCAFCDLTSTRPVMNEHLVRVHNIQLCTNKPLTSRRWTRKDKLKQHLKQVHSLADNSEGWKHWHRASERKYGYTCGYCGASLCTWEGTLSLFSIPM
jgi:hypothetical protein